MQRPKGEATDCRFSVQPLAEARNFWNLWRVEWSNLTNLHHRLDQVKVKPHALALGADNAPRLESAVYRPVELLAEERSCDSKFRV